LHRQGIARIFHRIFRDEDQHGVPVRRFVHPELMKFLLRSGQRIDS